MLYRLETEISRATLEKALQYIDEFEEVRGFGVQVLGVGFLPLLEVLGHADLRKPALQKPLAKLIGHVYEFRLNIVDTINTIMDSRIEQKNAEVYAWFITQIAISSAEARSNPLISTICDKLSAYKCESALQTILGRRARAPIPARHGYALDDLRADVPDTPGGRHNNDCVNYRDIAITPTIQQVESIEDPFFPPGRAVANMLAPATDCTMG